MFFSRRDVSTLRICHLYMWRLHGASASTLSMFVHCQCVCEISCQTWVGLICCWELSVIARRFAMYFISYYYSKGRIMVNYGFFYIWKCYAVVINGPFSMWSSTVLHWFIRPLIWKSFSYFDVQVQLPDKNFKSVCVTDKNEMQIFEQ